MTSLGMNHYVTVLFILHWSDLSVKATLLKNGLQPNFQAKSLSPQYKCSIKIFTSVVINGLGSQSWCLFRCRTV